MNSRQTVVTAKIILIFFQIQLREGINLNCGRRSLQHTALTTNGLQSKKGDWPWHAGIFHIGIRLDVTYKCGGTVLNSNLILTAAHCVYENDHLIINERISVNLGTNSLIDSDFQHFEVQKVIPHPNFNITGLSNDISIIRLATEAILNDFVQPICLWDSGRAGIADVIGRIGSVIGWGSTDKYKLSYILRQALIPIVSHSTCLSYNSGFFSNYLTERNFCAGFRNGTNVCNGDSGGSLTLEEDGVYYIRGIVSLTTPKREVQHLQDTKFCSEYVVFTDVVQYLPWIQLVVSKLKLPPLEIEADDLKADCAGGYFKCKVSGECFFKDKMCDGKIDCDDGSDETVVRCGYEVCIPGSGNCDETIDCGNYSDESPALCGYTTNITTKPSTRPTSRPTARPTVRPAAPPTDPSSCLIPDDLPNTIKIYYEADANQEITKGSYAAPFSNIIYKCKSKYVLEGNTTNFCLDGQWINQHSVCRKYCSPLPLAGVTIKASCEILGETVSCQQPHRPKTIVRITCAVGYRNPIDRNVIDVLHCTDEGFWDFPPFRCEQICGLEAPEVVPYIAGGEKVKVTKVPWHVGIYSNVYLKANFTQICGGTIINAKLVISAAHCFWDSVEDRLYEPSHFKIGAGKYYRDINAIEPTKPQILDVNQIITKQEYSDYAGYFALDIALLILVDHLKFNSYIKPICLETNLSFNQKNVQPGLIGKMAGWGLENSGGLSSPELKYIELPTIEYNDCKQNISAELRLFITGDKFCAGYTTGQSVCPGDSGGGLVFPKNVDGSAVYFLWGIVSTGGNKLGSCDKDQYSLFTNVQFHIEMVQYYESQNRPK